MMVSRKLVERWGCWLSAGRRWALLMACSVFVLTPESGITADGRYRVILVNVLDKTKASTGKSTARRLKKALEKEGLKVEDGDAFYAQAKKMGVSQRRALTTRNIFRIGSRIDADAIIYGVEQREKGNYRFSVVVHTLRGRKKSNALHLRHQDRRIADRSIDSAVAGLIKQLERIPPRQPLLAPDREQREIVAADVLPEPASVQSVEPSKGGRDPYRSWAMLTLGPGLFNGNTEIRSVNQAPFPYPTTFHPGLVVEADVYPVMKFSPTSFFRRFGVGVIYSKDFVLRSGITAIDGTVQPLTTKEDRLGAELQYRFAPFQPSAAPRFTLHAGAETLLFRVTENLIIGSKTYTYPTAGLQADLLIDQLNVFTNVTAIFGGSLTETGATNGVRGTTNGARIQGGFAWGIRRNMSLEAMYERLMLTTRMAGQGTTGRIGAEIEDTRQGFLMRLLTVF